MGNYSRNFRVDLDQKWNQHDVDGNKMLDKKECKNFLDDIYPHVDISRKRNYNP